MQQSNLATVSFLALATLLSSCSQPSIPKAESAVPNQYEQYQAELAMVQARQAPSAPPSLVMLGIDQSGSMTAAKVSPATVEDVNRVLQVIARQGGTFAMSAICDRSDRPLLRADFPESPQLDLRQVTLAPPPERPKTDRGNPFNHEKKLKAYEQTMQTANRDIAGARATLKQYTQQLEQHQADAQKQILSLKPQIEAILQHPRTCQDTDIQNSVQRANWLFLEPTNFSRAPRKYAMFITDGLDSFSPQVVDLKADQVILVNGSSNVGIFQSIRHQRFESPKAAFKMLTTWMQKP